MAFLLAPFNLLSVDFKSSEATTFPLPLNFWAQLFIIIFLFRYVRLIVNLIAFLTFASVPIPEEPTLSSDDVTVIVPSVQPYGEEFQECMQSVLQTKPGEILVVTVGADNLARAISNCQWSPVIRVLSIEVANKRVQICKALSSVKTPITILCDDHVFWPRTFIPHVLAPFEDKNVGAVGTCKRVRRPLQRFSFADFWNFIGALYLERHNFEIAATNHMDGGVFVLSGRTSAHRTVILQDPDFIHGFLNDYTFFGLVGPLHADDDNFITRWMVNHGWKICIQYSEGARIETTLGEYPKYLLQCIRWVRTTWRSNSTSLFSDRIVWRTQPWCVYAVHLTSFVNFALFYDSALILTLWFALDHSLDKKPALTYLGLWIFLSKLVKPFPYFWRRPQDLIYLPGYLLFGYFHSFIKLYAMFTFWVTVWGSRVGVDGRSEYGVQTGSESSVTYQLVVWGLIAMFPLFIIAITTYIDREAISLPRMDGMGTWTVAMQSAILLLLLAILVKWGFFTESHKRRLDQDIDEAVVEEDGVEGLTQPY